MKVLSYVGIVLLCLGSCWSFGPIIFGVFVVGPEHLWQVMPPIVIPSLLVVVLGGVFISVSYRLRKSRRDSMMESLNPRAVLLVSLAATSIAVFPLLLTMKPALSSWAAIRSAAREDVNGELMKVYGELVRVESSEVLEWGSRNVRLKVVVHNGSPLACTSVQVFCHIPELLGTLPPPADYERYVYAGWGMVGELAPGEKGSAELDLTWPGTTYQRRNIPPPVDMDRVFAEVRSVAFHIPDSYVEVLLWDEERTRGTLTPAQLDDLRKLDPDVFGKH